MNFKRIFIFIILIQTINVAYGGSLKKIPSKIEEYRISPDDLYEIGSPSSREPQVIYLYENPDDESRILYEFCTWKVSRFRSRGDCEILGNKKGVLKSVLLKMHKKHAFWGRVLTFANPLSTFAVGMAMIGVSTLSGGATSFFLGSAAALSIDFVDNKTSPTVHKDLTDTFKFDGSGGDTLKGMSIIQFAEILEKKIIEYTDDCVENSSLTKCSFSESVSP